MKKNLFTKWPRGDVQENSVNAFHLWNDDDGGGSAVQKDRGSRGRTFLFPTPVFLPVWTPVSECSVGELCLYQQQQHLLRKPTQMLRQTIPLGTFTSRTTTAPVAPFCCSSHPLRCSYSSPQRKRDSLFFQREEGRQNAPWLCPITPPPPPQPQLQALCRASLCPSSPQLPHGAGDSPPLWRAKGAMTDSTDGAWKSQAKTSALWRNKELREIWAGKKRKMEGQREGEEEKEEERGGEKVALV